MKDVIWLSLDENVPPNTYWDMTLLKELLKECNNHYEVGNLKEAIVVIPGQKQAHLINEINAELSKLDKCKVIISSDEENLFPIDQLSHPNMELFAQYYNTKYSEMPIRWLPIGPARINDSPLPTKEYSWFFSGQVNNDARRELVRALEGLQNGKLVTTPGFAQGMPQNEYYEHMRASRVAPAPKGVVSEDSFRFYEALEAGVYPVVIRNEFWDKTLKEKYYVELDSWTEMPYIASSRYSQHDINKVQASWMREKMMIKEELTGNDEITVIIPCSPIKSHPSTEIIDETITSIRHHLPNAKIIVTFDGIREEQIDRQEDYEEFMRSFLWKYNNKDIYPLIFDKHTHQVGMAKVALDHIKTPLVLYVEQDTPLVTDYDIPFGELSEVILEGKSNSIRFHHEAHIPEEHSHMMLGQDNYLMKTCQYSQRPHIASKAFYRRILNDYFSQDAVSFIEDKMHGVVHEAYKIDGILGWEQFKLHIYNPEGNIKRSYHTDGRSGEEKYDDTQIF
jgi:hypothetical protein